ncbi:methyl-accepting chemotaxis protein [Leptothoe spongobia]|uniref:HAMP domain-containing protein n=1 Tax=Leptothoe spongobia TAU-MAC 1115 TaxID=1967444 RepID=A0A947DI84_9CYAN|nr:methyl-accepting chemotaxis protein [Leptothoe spongobia]MBT9317498.1 HAMP domain-containing protein [Leptothoe spongobia TAU-MAC 1115]
MTAQQYSLDDQRQSPKPTKSQGRSLQNSTTEATEGRPLSRQLLQTLLPITLLPLVVASGLAILVTRQSEQEAALLLLKEESVLASEAANVFVEDNFRIIEGVLINPTILDAVRQADQDVEEKGLADQPIESLEKQFGALKLLKPNQVLNKYMADVVLVEGLGEIFITERHGLNVAYSNPTSDFVQWDEAWWQGAKESIRYVEPVEFDESSNSVGLPIAKTIHPADNPEEFLGVMKALFPLSTLNERLEVYLTTAISGSQKVQVMDTRTLLAFSTITADSSVTVDKETLDATIVDGGEPVAQFAQALYGQLGRTGEDVEIIKQELAPQLQGNLVELERIETSADQEILIALLKVGGREYSIATVPNAPWVAIASVDIAEINSAGRNLLLIFATTTAVLGVTVAVLLQVFARQLSAPLQTLTATSQKASSGDLDTRAMLAGTRETKILGQSFNNLLDQLQSLINQQKQLADEQREEREALENDITQLMEEVGDAADGDLSVRAKLSSNDVGIVADLINAIVENLREIAVNVKESTGDVSQSLLANEQQIRTLAEQAIEEVNSLQTAVKAVEEMDQSIQTVADNANEASTLTNDTYVTAQTGSLSMEETAGSILDLRSTVGETAKKIKRLGESAQKIAQAVSLIDEIALKTNLLAVNASVEASRAGELGQGFTAVAEQVGSLAEQSAGATKTIAQIVAEIQTETQEVVEAIETGTAQVVDSSQRVKATQQQLEQVLAKSEKINQLMQDISASTINQTMVSKAVTELMQKATQTSEQQSQSSTQVAQAIQETAQVAQKLQASVEQFKVEG